MQSVQVINIIHVTEASPKPDVDVAATPAATATATATARIKLRDGWGYKIGGTRFRAVFDPERKAIPKLPERPPGGYEVVGLSVKKEGGEGDGGEGISFSYDKNSYSR